MSVVWSFPTQVVFGEGTVDTVGSEAKRFGATHALIVTDEGVVNAGLIAPIAESLSAAGIRCSEFSSVSSNPLESEVLSAADAYAKQGADLVIGVGGGSPLDVAKLVRLAATHPLPLSQYDDAANGSEKIVAPLPPMLAIPTTAGTGSEVGRSGVVTIQATGRKTVIFSPRLLPNVAILDPVLTETLSPRTTAATGFDALSHCIEAYCAKGDHPMADAIALAGARLVVDNLERVVRDGQDRVARGEMLKASMMGAVAFQKGLGACHSLAHPLSDLQGLHHGLANALCLPAVLDFNRGVIPERIAAIGTILGARGTDVETLAFECSGALRALRKKVGLPGGLSELDVDEEALPDLAAAAIADACHALNPRDCTEEDMLALYRASC